MKTKVIEMIGSLSDGGAQALVKDYACLLDKEEFDVKLLCIFPLKRTVFSKALADNGIDVIHLYKNHNFIRRVYKYFFGKWYIPYALKKNVLNLKPDIIHIHLANLRYFAPISHYLHGIKLYYTCHTVPSQMFSKKNEKEFYAAQELIKNNNLKMIALHNEMADIINNMFGIKDSLVIRNGIDLDRFKKTNETKSSLRKKNNIDQDAFVIGNIGRLSGEKNQLFLLDILKAIAERNINVHLLIIGSGYLKNEIISKATDLNLSSRVTILSHRTDIPELLRLMDVFVFPSLFEGFPVTLVEAQAAGLKCVISDRINKECVLSDKTLVVPLESPAEIWADAILDETKRNPDHGNLDDYDMNREIKHLEKVYLSC